ncbi:Imm43 family immunity protein [Burkholderia sp. YIM B11467]
MSSYYALLEKKERGCPVGAMQGVVYDKFVENVLDLNYGEKPWYNYRDLPGEMFSGEMFLISRDKLISYDIRSSGGDSKFHIVSQGFLEILIDFSVPIQESRPIAIVDSKGRDISEKKYHIISFGSDIYKEDVLDKSSIVGLNEFGDRFIVGSVDFKGGFKSDFFKIKNLDLAQSAIFCSEEFVREAVKRKVVAGVEFRGIEEVDWASVSPDNLLGFLAGDSEPLLFIH